MKYILFLQITFMLISCRYETFHSLENIDVKDFSNRNRRIELVLSKMMDGGDFRICLKDGEPYLYSHSLVSSQYKNGDMINSCKSEINIHSLDSVKEISKEQLFLFKDDLSHLFSYGVGVVESGVPLPKDICDNHFITYCFFADNRYWERYLSFLPDEVLNASSFSDCYKIYDQKDGLVLFGERYRGR